MQVLEVSRCGIGTQTQGELHHGALFENKLMKEGLR